MRMMTMRRMLLIIAFLPGAAGFGSQAGPDRLAAAGAGGPAHIAGEVVVKLREPALKAMGKVEGANPQQLAKLMPSTIQMIHQRLGVRAVEPVFPPYAAEQRRLDDIKSRHRKGMALGKAEQRLAQRMARAPQGAVAPRLDAIFLARLDPARGISVEEAVALYRQDPNVEYAEPNFIISLEPQPAPAAGIRKAPVRKALAAEKRPNDPLFPDQWALENTGQSYPTTGYDGQGPGYADCDISAPEAWALSTGGDVVVAVLDTGIDLTHEDLQGNLWSNAAELNGLPNVDDDHNGYVDDLHGRNFLSTTKPPQDDNGHGTHCAGIIAACGNNGVGITGVCWNAKVMALKFLGSNMQGNGTNAAAALRYATAHGADVISCSISAGTPSDVLSDAIRDAISHGVLVVAAAGNTGTDESTYPACDSGVLSVAASDSRDWLARFSNYNAMVDVRAPGVDILSLKAKGTNLGTLHTSQTTVMSGTSQACPYAAGVAALILSKKPTLNIDQLIGLLKLTADVQEGQLHWAGDGRVNAAAALAESALPLTCRLEPPPKRASDGQSGGVFSLKGSASGPLFTSYTLSCGIGREPQKWKRLGTSKSPVTSGTLLAICDSWPLEDGIYTFRLVATDTRGRQISDAQVVRIRNITATSPQPNDILKPGKTIEIRVAAGSTPLTPISIEWGEGANPTQWSAQGITLMDGKGGVMGKWNTAFITSNGIYSLRTRFRTGDGRQGVSIVRAICMDARLKDGWPQYVSEPEGAASDYAKLAADDLDGDGHREIICLEPDSDLAQKPAALLAYRDNGQLLWRRNLDRYPTLSGNGRPYGPPVIGDLDGDGKKEIVIDSGCHSVQSVVQGFMVYAVRCDGTIMPGWPLEMQGHAFDKLIADVDHDGRREVVLREMAGAMGTGVASQYLYIVNAAGQIRKKIKMGEGSEKSSPLMCHGLAVGQFDDAPDLEIVTYILKADKSQQPVVMKWDGAPLAGWPMAMQAQYVGNFITADLNRDGYDEALFLASESAEGKKDGGIYAVDRSGAPLPGWPISPALRCVAVMYSMGMSVGDINGDDLAEVVVSCHLTATGSTSLAAYDRQGLRLRGWPTYTPSSAQPVIGDISGDGVPDIVGVGGALSFFPDILALNETGSGGVYAWRDGGSRIDLCPENPHVNTLWMEGGYSPREIILDDIDDDGRVELVAASRHDVAQLPVYRTKQRNSIYVWDLPAMWNWPLMHWSGWQNGPALTGHYSPPQTPNAAKGWNRFQ